MATTITDDTRAPRVERQPTDQVDGATRPGGHHRARRRRSGASALVACVASTMAVFGAGALGGPAFADTVRVGPGDTLTAIAARHHTTVAALAAANGIADPNRLMIGTVLQVPGAPSVPSAATVPSSAGVTTTVVVRAGDTLTSIASRNHITVAALVKANNIANPNFVLIGTRLQVPNGLAPLPSGSAPADAVTAKLLAHPERLALRTDFVRAAAASGLAPNLLEAMCWWESGWQNSATSSTGAMGVCQLEPSTVGYARTKLLHNTALDPRVGPDNIAMAAAYLHDLVGRSGGDVSTALAGYYQGLPSVQRGGLLTSTQAYVKGILGYAAIFPSTG